MSPQPTRRPRVLEASVAQHLRTFDDAASIDRTWRKIHRSTAVSAGPSRKAPLIRLLSAAALLGAGMLMGIFFEKNTGEGPSFTVRSEQVTAHQAMAPQTLEATPQKAHASTKQKLSTHGTTTEVPVRRQRLERRSDLKLPVGAPVVDATETRLSDELSLETSTAVSAPARPEWMALAERGDFSGAFQKLDESGGFDQALLSAGPDELMTLADVARAVSRQGRAIQALRIVLDQYRDNENAPLAAMMLGNLLSRTGDSAGAAQAFALNRRLSPGGDFAEDALVREFDMAITAKDVLAAERLRAQYEREYPEGRHREALQGDLDRLASELAPTTKSSAYDEDTESEDSELSDEVGDAATRAPREETPSENSRAGAPAP